MLPQAVDQIREVMERRRNVPFGGKDNFSVSTAAEQVAQFHQIVDKVALAMVVLSSVGLLVGGIGVMNIMLVSVTERTREIGVRKAIGARQSDITWQFLLEAMTLTGVGGVAGAGTGKWSGGVGPADSELARGGAGVGGRHRRGSEREYWADFRGLAGDEGGETGPGRSAPV